MRKLKIIEVKSELGAGTRGASLGADAIKIAALDFGSRYFKENKTIEIPNENHLLLEPAGSPFAKRIPGVLTMVKRTADEVAKTLINNEFPIILAGDHSTASGTIAGIKKAYPDQKLGVIWIDAHADIHSPYTTPSGNLHGMTLAAALAEDNIVEQINKPDQETLSRWNQLKNAGGMSPKITPDSLVYIGIRETEEQEEKLIQKHNIKKFITSDIRGRGTKLIAEETLAYLAGCDKIYISFDVDSMDATISRGTGTPVVNGISKNAAQDLLGHLIQSKQVCCFEIVEVNPTLDKDNLTAENAFEILANTTKILLNT